MIFISDITHLNEEKLFIIQYNAHRSKNNVMIVFLRDSKVLKYDIIVIQKSWRNNYQTTTHFLNIKWFNLIYVEQFDIENMKFKICFYINKRINRFKMKIHFDFKDIFNLKIQLKSFNSNFMHTIWIHNIYNELNTSSTFVLHKL